MQKSCRCGFMYGDLTDKETIARIEECLEGQIHDQFEILLYKKNSEFSFCLPICSRISLNVLHVPGITDYVSKRQCAATF